MGQPKIKYQSFKFSVAAVGNEITIDEATDKRYKYVTGIHIAYSNDAAAWSEIQLDIGSEEITPEGFEVQRIRLNTFVPADFQFKTILAEAAGSTVKGKYKDIDLFGTTYPYKLVITLRLENELPKCEP
jgi:hypothetical protein